MISGNPGFAIVVVLTLALGIASTTTVFAWIDHTLLRPFPGASRGDELAVVETITANAPNGGTQVSWLDYRDFRDHSTLLSGLALHRNCAFTLGDAASSQLVWGELVSADYFAVLGVKPVLGRMFDPEKYGDFPGAYPTAVIGERLWRSSRFHSNPAIIGKAIRVNRQAVTVIGVAPSEFRGTVPGLIYDLWVPVTMGAQMGLLSDSTFKFRWARMFFTIARRQPGASVEQARAELSTLAAALEAANPKTNRGIAATVLPTWGEHNGVSDYLLAPLRILMAVAVVVLLIVCANVANLLLARSVARQREFGIRFALGAGRVRIVRQLLTETLILAAAGATIAIPLMMWMSESLPSLVPNVGLPIAIDHPLDARIFGFTALACLLAALVSGIAPALLSLRSDLNDALKEGGRAGTPTGASHRTRGMLVVAEMALAIVALVGAGLFVKSFRNARAIHPGFDASKVLFGRFFIESAAYSGDQIQQFAIRMRQQLEATPGIEAVSYSDFVPLSSTAGAYNDVLADGYVPAQDEPLSVNRAVVAPGYFAVVRTPLLEGRDFTDRDDPKTPPVMIVNESFAKRYFRGGNPVGRQVRCMRKQFTVVGLVKDSKYFNPAESPRPFFYVAFRQFYSPTPELDVFIRTALEPSQAIATLRRTVATIDPNAAAFHAVPLAEYTQVALFGQKVAASLMGALGLICLLLAALGLYSVMSYSVSQRRQEIGIRMAMGARPGDVVGMVVRQGMKLAIMGLATGAVVAFGVTRLVSSMLVKVDGTDPAVFGGAALFLGSVAFIACWLPARRATGIDPMTALRR
jgi:predicted permease